ncbi:Uncharacterised protein [Mycobacteroides abscessus subsp. massiliense]|nr:Uncharacterised protein [Mycobacteroides abscessus subsp. massiliense]
MGIKPSRSVCANGSRTPLAAEVNSSTASSALVAFSSSASPSGVSSTLRVLRSTSRTPSPSSSMDRACDSEG